MHRPIRVAVLLLAANCLPGTEAAAADDELGAFLAGTCAACHRAGGQGTEIPSIVGLDEARFKSLMRAYRSGARADAVMHAVADSLSEEDTAALAHYLATQGQPK